MKKPTLGLTVATVLAAITLTQGEMAITPGLELGLNMANVSVKDSAGDKPSSIDAKMGFIGGAVVAIGLNDMLSLVPGIGFAMRGATTKIEIPGAGTTEGALSTNYLDIPILLVAKFGSGNIVPFISVGPEIGILMSAELNVKSPAYSMGPITVPASDTTMDVKDDLNTLEMGVNISVGAEMKAGNLYPYLKAGYYLGLTNARKDPAGDESTNHTGIPIQLGLRFKM